GRPPLACTFCSCWLTGATGGGGAVFATTGRAIACAGGRARAGAAAPTRLRCCGATAGVKGESCAEATLRASTRTILRPTGCAEVNEACEVAVTYVRFW